MSLPVACVSHDRSQLALTVDRVANPDKGTAVVLATVTDKRRFRAQTPGEGAGAQLMGDLLFSARSGSPHHGSTASLDSWEETRDPALRARTIARPYDGQGIPGGNILLPAGDSVTETVRGVLETGLREAGYRVVTKGSAAAKGALTLDAGIEDYWCWSANGNQMYQRTRINLIGDWPLREPLDFIFLQTNIQAILPNAEDWNKLFKASHADLRAKLKQVLK